MSRVFLCDPSLQGLSGHCLNYLSSIRRVLPASKEVFFLGNVHLENILVEQYQVRPSFSLWIDQREYDAPFKNAACHQQSIQKDLETAHAQFAFNGDDILFINSLRHWSLAGVLRWLESLGVEKAPRVLFVLHFSAYTSPSDSEAWAAIYRDFFKDLRLSPVREKIRLFADSDALVEEFAGLGADQIRLAPIPHIPDFPEREHDAPLVVSYLGAARPDKGFKFLPYLLKRSRYMDGPPDVRFKVMAWCDDPKAPFFAWNINILRQDPRVELFMSPLDEEQYSDIVKSTDIGLVLYNSSIYSRQTSGIFSELAAAGAVVVATRGTWAARQVERFDLGALAMPDDAISIGDALVDVLANYRQWSGRVRKNRKTFLDFHNPRNFVKTVMGGLE